MKKIISVAAVLSLMAFGIGYAGTGFASTHLDTVKTIAHHSHAKQDDRKAIPVNGINLNDADAQTLATLKGIGPKKAAAIIAYRQQHGPFNSLSDLNNIKGIGAKWMARLLKNNPGKILLN